MITPHAPKLFLKNLRFVFNRVRKKKCQTYQERKEKLNQQKYA